MGFFILGLAVGVLIGYHGFFAMFKWCVSQMPLKRRVALSSIFSDDLDDCKKWRG